ncbi:hypothetical protein BC941DRAFT_470634 [Chlamydoabsidia padenii]|nr:hypothetical protein BC941DRAFT_470634 [Chlamydoabsidia padenii]
MSLKKPFKANIFDKIVKYNYDKVNMNPSLHFWLQHLSGLFLIKANNSARYCIVTLWAAVMQGIVGKWRFTLPSLITSLAMNNVELARVIEDLQLVGNVLRNVAISSMVPLVPLKKLALLRISSNQLLSKQFDDRSGASTQSDALQDQAIGQLIDSASTNFEL